MQEEVQIQFVRTHPDAKLPTKAYAADNCWDLYAVEDTVIPGSIAALPLNFEFSGVDIGTATVPVGLNLGYITPGFGFTIKPRSGLGFKYGITPHFGEIDNLYRGSLGIKLYNFTSTPYYVKAGDRIAQFKVEKVWQSCVQFAAAAQESQRGEGGFGSSGK